MAFENQTRMDEVANSHDLAVPSKYKERLRWRLSTEPNAPLAFMSEGSHDLQYYWGTAVLLPLTMKHAEAHWLVSSMPNQCSANGTPMRVSASLLGVHIAVG